MRTIRTLLAGGMACFLATVQAQCPPGQVEVIIAVTTDAYGYETYWELLPGGSPCGNGTIFAGGNPAVGCNGAGAQQQTPGGYGNNQTYNEGPFCLVQGNTYDIFWADDWGDAGLSFQVFVNGAVVGQFVGTGAGQTFSFQAAEPAARDMLIEEINVALYATRDEPVRIVGVARTMGTDPVQSLTLSYRIDGGAVVDQTITGLNLTSGGLLPFEHASPWIPSTSGLKQVEVWVSGINGLPDLNPSNDVAQSSTLVRDPIPQLIDAMLAAPVSVDIIANSGQDLLVPRDLDFHPDPARNELWVINKDVANSGGSTVRFFGPGEPGMTWLWQRDPNAWHFMNLPTAIAFGDNGNFATAPGIFDANQNGGTPFTGPTLWSSDPAIYAQNLFGPLGSHLDMLHVTPNSQGIAHDQWNRYWVVDGYNGDVVYHDFRRDHGPGNSWHGDAIIRRYSEFTITRDPNDHIVSHCRLHKPSGQLYVVDHGGQRVLRLDTRTGSVSGPATFGPWETYVEYTVVSGYDHEVIVSSGLVAPAGVDVIGDRLLVSDHATGEVVVYDLSSSAYPELGRLQVSGPGLMGIRVGPDGSLWAVNASDHQLIRVSAAGSVGLTGPSHIGTSKVWPTPADDRVFLSAPQWPANTPVELFDALGRLVRQTTVGVAVAEGMAREGESSGVHLLRVGDEVLRVVWR